MNSAVLGAVSVADSEVDLVADSEVDLVADSEVDFLMGVSDLPLTQFKTRIRWDFLVVSRASLAEVSVCCCLGGGGGGGC